MKPISAKTIADLLSKVRKRRPLVHHITNTVTINDCANATLAIGGAPVMAEAIEEVAEMAGLADALVLNIGTLSQAQIRSMLEAGKAANRKGIPVILDPVGAGATSLRTSSAKMILREVDIAVLKGNAGEIGVLAGAEAKVRGVDAAGLEGDPAAIALAYARTTGTVVAVSGATDIVTDGKQIVLIRNGHPMMGRMSGTGCMAASVTGAFSAVTKDRVAAAAAAFVAFGIAGEMAAVPGAGPSTFRTNIIDCLAGIGPDDIKKHARLLVP